MKHPLVEVQGYFCSRYLTTVQLGLRNSFEPGRKSGTSMCRFFLNRGRGRRSGSSCMGTSSQLGSATGVGVATGFGACTEAAA